MCAAAIAQARVGKLVFGAYDPKSGGVEHGPKIFEHSHHKPDVIGGILEKECSKIMTDFFKEKR
jgi:tRNA(adenine34) deaminase